MDPGSPGADSLYLSSWIIARYYPVRDFCFILMPGMYARINT